MNRGYYDPEHDPALGCIAWIIGILLVVCVAAWVVGALTSNDPSGRCDYEPGPNGITIANCEPEN